MKSFTYKIKAVGGIHARPAGAIVSTARKFSSRITLTRISPDGKRSEGDGKRLISLMTLGAVQGDEVIFYIEGDDEESAAAALLEVCRESLG